MFGSNSRNLEKMIRRDHWNRDFDEDRQYGNKKILRSIRRQKRREMETEEQYREYCEN